MEDGGAVLCAAPVAQVSNLLCRGFLNPLFVQRRTPDQIVHVSLYRISVALDRSTIVFKPDGGTTPDDSADLEIGDTAVWKPAPRNFRPRPHNQTWRQAVATPRPRGRAIFNLPSATFPPISGGVGRFFLENLFKL
jgi:hypothetical protein